MVYASRRATIKLGKYQDALKWAKGIAEFLNKKYGTNYSVYTQLWGENPNSIIFWIGKYESMEQLLEISGKLNEDQEYITKLADSPSLFIDGSVYDSVLEKH